MPEEKPTTKSFHDNESEDLKREDRKNVYGDFYRRRATRHEWEKKMHPVPSAILNGFMLLFTAFISFILPVFGLAAWLIYRDVREGHGQYSFVGLALGTTLWTVNFITNFFASWFFYG